MAAQIRVMTLAAGCCAFVGVSSLLFADDIKTATGKEYKNATVTRVEADGIVVTFPGGIVKLYFVELPKELQEKYLPQPAAAESSSISSQSSAVSASQRTPAVTEHIEQQGPRIHVTREDLD